jgi:ribosomal protein S18 acetylase RimI-like enzyme
MLTVAPQLKRLGCAQRVLDFAAATAVQAYRAAWLDVNVVSVKPWLLAFYTARNGFTVVGEEPWPAGAEDRLLRPCYFHRARKALLPAPGAPALP